MKLVYADTFDGGSGITRGGPSHDKITGSPIDLATVLNSIDADYTLAQAQALGADYWNGTIYVGGKPYRWNATSLANDPTGQLAIRPTALSTIQAGRFELDDTSFTLSLAATFATANGAALFTVPAGWRLLLSPRCLWDNSVAWTGGSSSAIGASSSNAAYNTPGDLQGGAGGDLTAAMGVGLKAGSAIGAKFPSQAIVALIAGDTILFNRIASVYTAGAGNLLVPARRI